jgi:ribonucleoside-triphosphate reductase (thioredoxin)
MTISLFALPLHGPEFALDADFVDQYRDRPVKWGPVGYVTYKRTYARRLADDRTEEWVDTIRRVVEGCYQIQQRHCQHHNVPWLPTKAQRSAQEMFKLIFDFKFTPPGRGLWMMGTEFVEERGSAAVQNCAMISTREMSRDVTRPFTFTMDMLMLGVGVAGDTLGAGTVLVCGAEEGPQHVFQIPDTREGWVEAWKRAIEAYFGGPSYVFDYTKLRPEGSPITGFGGTASGPGPLRELLEKDTPRILDPLIGQMITSTAIVDLFNVTGKCVVAGNVRRSAELLLGDPEDEQYLDLKNPEVNSERMRTHGWASNNSVRAYVGMDYTAAASRSAKAGEPGYVYLGTMQDYGRLADPADYADRRVVGCNPCAEMALESGELCNLVETYPAHHESYEEYERTLKYAYLYAKTVTLLPTHDQETNAIMMRNRRIGVSQSGIMQSFAKHGRRTHLDWSDQGYQYLARLDRIYSDWLAVPLSKRRTTVKPSGTVSKLCGATAGIHYAPAEHYIQRIRFAAGTPLLAALQAAGYPSESCVYSEGATVVEFPVKTENFTKSEQDVTLWEQMSNAAALQKYWADNQVSCTVKFTPDEAQDIESALELFEDKLKTISFLPHDHGYAQAPWEPISKEEYEARAAVVQPIVSQGNTHDTDEKFCDGGSCEVNFG